MGRNASNLIARVGKYDLSNDGTENDKYDGHEIVKIENSQENS
jgi:hypothetical protein